MRLSTSVLVLCLLAPLSAGAEGPSYSYVQADYLKFVPDEGDIEGDGFGVRLSHLLNESVFLLAGYEALETDDVDTGFGTGAFELSQLTAGLGVRGRIGRNSDVVASAALMKAEIEGNGFFAGLEDDDTGFELRLGVRGMASPTLELGLGAVHVDVFEDDTNSAVLDAVAYLGDALGLAGSIEVSSDDKLYRAGVRIRF